MNLDDESAHHWKPIWLIRRSTFFERSSMWKESMEEDVLSEIL